MSSSYDKTDRSLGSQRSMSTAVDDISDAATRVQQQATEQFDKQIDRLSSSIRNKPIQSAAIAAGVGFLFAVIARR